jgi:MFS family permease
MGNSNSQELFYGWRIVAASFVIIFSSTGIIFYSFGVFVPRLELDLGWSATQLGLAVSVWALLFGFSGPLVGVFIEKYGAKRVIAFCALITGLCYLFLSRITELYQLFILMAIVGVGSAGITLVPNQTLISNWFEKRRGRAMGLMMMGIGFGGLAMPPLADYLIEKTSWRSSFLMLGILLLAAIIPITLLVVRTKPSDMGLQPDGDGSGGDSDSPSEDEQTAGASGLEVKRALSTSSFWLLFVAFVLLVFGESGLTVHFIRFAGWEDITYRTASYVWGFAIFMSALGRLGFGFLADRQNPRNLIAVTHGLHAVAMLILIVFFIRMESHSLATYVLFSLVYGLSLGGSAVLLPVMTVRCFGLLNFSKVLGLLMMGFALGVVGGPLLAGNLSDKTGSYEVVLLIFAIAFGMAAVSVAFIKPDKYKHEFFGAEAQ